MLLEIRYSFFRCRAVRKLNYVLDIKKYPKVPPSTTAAGINPKKCIACCRTATPSFCWLSFSPARRDSRTPCAASARRVCVRFRGRSELLELDVSTVIGAGVFGSNISSSQPLISSLIFLTKNKKYGYILK